MADQTDLIAALQPDRDYGRPFEDVLADVRAGALILVKGLDAQPIIQNAATGTFVKGTGRRAGSQEFKYNAEEVARALSADLPEFITQFKNDLRKTGDPRLYKILFERVAGPAGVSDGGMPANEVLELLKAAAGHERQVTIEVQ